MANRTNLSSWGNLRDYLKTNVDPDKDWDNEDIQDYSSLLGAQAAGKVSGDKFTEGRNLFQHYLADAQATDVYQQAQAKAENEARRETAYGNYLSTRLGSYLREIQGNAGIAGYGGLTQGQAIAVKNDQENAFRAVQESKKSAIQGYLDTYQGALANNSATAIDQATALDAAIDAREEDKKLSVQEYVKQYLDAANTDENGEYSAETKSKVNEYIKNSGLNEEAQAEVQKNVDLLYGDEMKKQVTNENGVVVTQSASRLNAISQEIQKKMSSVSSEGKFSELKNYLDLNKDVLGSNYDTYLTQAKQSAEKWLHTKDKGYSVQGLSKTLTTTDDIDVTIEGSVFDLVSGKAVEDKDTITSLNTIAVGWDSYPSVGTIVVKDDAMYIYKDSRNGKYWRKMEDDIDSISDAVKAWKKYSS